MRLLEKLKIAKGMRVLLRVDYNVPISGAEVAESWRIERTLPTIEYLLYHGARIIILSHLGRPDGSPKKEFSLRPVAEKLGQLLGKTVLFLEEEPGSRALLDKVQSLPQSGVAMLENLRFYPGEDENNPDFSKMLAPLGDVFVNDAFGAVHRKSASIVGLPGILPHAAGILMEHEVEMLNRFLGKLSKPFLLLAGGAKVSDKIGVIDNLSKKADKILLGGGLANNFFAAKGYGIGRSLSAPEEIALAKKMLKNKKIILPSDVVVGEIGKEKSAKVVSIGEKRQELAKGRRIILDIGPKSIELYSEEIKKAKTILWNGPMGYFEEPQFSHGTLALARMVAARSKGKAFGVIGGGETVAAMRRTKMEEMVDWVSTGGGAMLEFLEGKTLPGIKALT